MSVDITRSAPACPQMPPLQEQGRVRVGEDHGARGKGQAYKLLQKEKRRLGDSHRHPLEEISVHLLILSLSSIRVWIFIYGCRLVLSKLSGILNQIDNFNVSVYHSQI